MPRARSDGPTTDDTGCTILHVDMDAFYASVEIRRRPELRGRAVVVGGSGRGVVLSASYPARAFGVRSAMPIGRARRLCPHAVFVQPDFPAYVAASRAVFELFRAVTPLVEPLSLDEAFLDVTGAQRRLGSPATVGGLIRARIAAELGLTCSVGVAPTKFVAKLASTRCKPDGLLVVPGDRLIAFLHPLPVAALWGVGERTEAQLARLGLRTVGDLARTPAATLRRAVGPTLGDRLADLASGRDPRRVTPDEPDKSIGAERTFPVDVDDPSVVHRELLRLAEHTAGRLRACGQRGRTVCLKIRLADFSTITRSRTLPAPTDVGQEVYAAARGLLAGVRLDRARLRLVGVRVEGLVRADHVPEQLALGGPAHGWRDAELAMDEVTRRFGAGSVRPASLVVGMPPTSAGPAARGGGVPPAGSTADRREARRSDPYERQ